MNKIILTSKIVKNIEEGIEKLEKTGVKKEYYKIIFKLWPYIGNKAVDKKDLICGLPFEVRNIQESVLYIIAPKNSMYLEE